MPMRNVHRLIALGTVVVSIAACGGSDSESAATDAPIAPAASEAPAAPTSEAPAPAATDAPAPATDAPAATEAPATDAPAAPAGEATVIDVELDEWTVVLSGPVPAGAVTFNVVNVGEFPHELVIIAGKYMDMAKEDNGAVIEGELPEGSLLDEVETLEPGASGSVTVDMPAGHYSLLCNIAFGGSSHVGRGQILEIDVA